MDLVPQFEADTTNLADAQASLIERGVIVVKRGPDFVTPLVGPFHKIMEEEETSEKEDNHRPPREHQAIQRTRKPDGARGEPACDRPHQSGSL